jgi:hypothetical protein
MFVFFTSFGAIYPPGNRIILRGYTFQDLTGVDYSLSEGHMDTPVPGRMTWTKDDVSGVIAPYYFSDKTQQVNVYVVPV